MISSTKSVNSILVQIHLRPSDSDVTGSSFMAVYLVRGDLKKQVTRGHNIVADGWAGESNPQPHLPLPTRPPPHTLTRTNNCSMINERFSRFQLSVTEEPMDGRTDGRRLLWSCVTLTKRQSWNYMHLLFAFKPLIDIQQFLFCWIAIESFISYRISCAQAK